ASSCAGNSLGGGFDRGVAPERRARGSPQDLPALPVSCRQRHSSWSADYAARGTRARTREIPWHTKGTAVAFRVPGPQRPGGTRPLVLPRWPRYVIPVVIIGVAAAILLSIIAGVWTDYLWFASVGQSRVFATTYSTKWALFGVVAV